MKWQRNRNRGASLVEFAVLAPLLVTLLLGIAEFGWLYSQQLDLRHGAREGARLAATNAGSGSEIVTWTCDRLDRTAGATFGVRLERTGAIIGSTATVTLQSVPAQLTGFFSALMPATLEASIETRLERSATWSPTGGFTSC